MRLITDRTIDDFGKEHAAAQQALSDWCAQVRAARWTSPEDVRRSIGASARPIGANRFVFNIKGNAYRIVAEFRYAALDTPHHGIVWVHFVGTHAEYDLIDARTIQYTRRTP